MNAVPAVEGGEAPGGASVAHTGASLVIDVDGHAVRGVLFDAVEGQGRFVASAETVSTAGPPIGDLSVAVRDVVASLESQTGLKLMGGERESSELVALALSGHPVAPLRVALVPTGSHGLTPALSAIARATTSIVDVVDSNVRTEDGVLSATLLETRLRGFRPDVIVLLEGSRAQAEWASAVGTFGTLIGEGLVSQLIVLASEDFQQHVIQTLGERANLTGLDPAQYEAHEVAAALEAELLGHYEERVAMGPALGLQRSPTFVSRSRAGDLAARFIARRQAKSVAAISVAEGTVINWSTIHSGAALNRPDLDLHANIRGLFGPAFEFARALLPIDLSQEDLANWILNRALRPRVQAATIRDQVIESVLSSGLLHQAWQDLSGIANDQLDLLIGGRAFCNDRYPALGALALLNGLQPAPLGGVVEVYLDPDGLLISAGAIGEMVPALAAEAIEHDLLSPAATVIVVEGEGSEGEVAVTGRLTYEDGETVALSVPFGTLQRLQLGEGDRASLLLVCEPGYTIGGSNPGEELEFGQTHPLRGGEVGVLIDVRGRPLESFGSQSAATRERVRRWYSELGIEW
jgi:hypothetical protein